VTKNVALKKNPVFFIVLSAENGLCMSGFLKTWPFLHSYYIGRYFFCSSSHVSADSWEPAYASPPFRPSLSLIACGLTLRQLRGSMAAYVVRMILYGKRGWLYRGLHWRFLLDNWQNIE